MNRCFSLLVVSLFLGACATTAPQKPPVLQKLAAAGVDASTQARIANGRVLGFGDIQNLVRAKVPGKAIVSYLKSTHAPYRFTTGQLEQLSDAGAGSTLVNYLGQSVGYYEATKRAQTGGAGKWDSHPYFTDPGYWGPAPFGYEFPGDWGDPALFTPWF